MGIAVVALVILIALNAFFAASEIALVSLNDNKVKRMAERGDKTAKPWINYYHNQDDSWQRFRLGLL